MASPYLISTPQHGPKYLRNIGGFFASRSSWNSVPHPEWKGMFFFCSPFPRSKKKHPKRHHGGYREFPHWNHRNGVFNKFNMNGWWDYGWWSSWWPISSELSFDLVVHQASSHRILEPLEPRFVPHVKVPDKQNKFQQLNLNGVRADRNLMQLDLV